MDDLLEQFLLEARELAQQAADDLLKLEQAPADRERLDSAFRAVHTLKGSVGLFDFEPMAKALHAGEDLLGAMRDGEVGATRDTIGENHEVPVSRRQLCDRAGEGAQRVERVRG